MSDLRETADGDIDLTSKDAVMVDGPDETMQRLRHKLRLFRGEWFRNRAAGTPYREVVWPKTVSHTAKVSLFRQILTKDPAVSEVLALELIEQPGRVGELRFQVRHRSGVILRSEDYTPYVLQ